MASKNHSIGDPLRIEIVSFVGESNDVKISPKQGKETLITCLICYSDLPTSEIHCPLSCKHSFCLDCFRGHIENKMQAFQVPNIPCPQDGCQEVFTDKQIMNILDENKYNRYQELVLKKLANKNPAKRFCPKPGCARPVQIKKNKEYVSCPCGAQICLKCFNFAHPGKSCLNALSPEFELYAQENEIKSCMVCKTPVARVEGCLHMTCCVCDYEWCWTCGRQYDLRHKCIGYWSPSAPETGFRGKLEDLKKTSKKVMLYLFNLVVLFPILLAVFMVFWPLIISEKLQRKISFRRRPLTSIGIMLAACLLGLITLPVTILWMLVASLIVFPIRFVILTKRHGLGYWIGHKKARPQRWKDGNPSKFTYTEVARPSENPQNGGLGPRRVFPADLINPRFLEAGIFSEHSEDRENNIPERSDIEEGIKPRRSQSLPAIMPETESKANKENIKKLSNSLNAIQLSKNDMFDKSQKTKSLLSPKILELPHIAYNSNQSHTISFALGSLSPTKNIEKLKEIEENEENKINHLKKKSSPVELNAKGPVEIKPIRLNIISPSQREEHVLDIEVS